MVKFSSVPAWQLLDEKKAREAAALAPAETELVVAANPALFKAALAGVEYRGFKAFERAVELAGGAGPAVYARSPNDLPALLRTADQLLAVARRDAGEKQTAEINAARIELSEFFREAMARGWPVLVSKA